MILYHCSSGVSLVNNIIKFFVFYIVSLLSISSSFADSKNINIHNNTKYVQDITYEIKDVAGKYSVCLEPYTSAQINYIIDYDNINLMLSVTQNYPLCDTGVDITTKAYAYIKNKASKPFKKKTTTLVDSRNNRRRVQRVNKMQKRFEFGLFKREDNVIYNIEILDTEMRSYKTRLYGHLHGVERFLRDRSRRFNEQ